MAQMRRGRGRSFQTVAPETGIVIAKCLDMIGGTGVSLVGGINGPRRRMTESKIV